MRRSFARYCIVYTLLLFLVTGCGKEYLSEQELAAYVLDSGNGLTKTALSGSTKMSVSWQPNDLMVARELRNKKTITIDALRDARAKYADQTYFIVRLSSNGKDIATPNNVGFAGFNDLVQTLSFGMADKVSLVGSARDTSHVADFIYSRTFGAARSSDLLFAFKRKDLDPSSRQLEFNLYEFGLGTSTQVFRFDLEDMEAAPEIFDENKINVQ